MFAASVRSCHADSVAQRAEEGRRQRGGGGSRHITEIVVVTADPQVPIPLSDHIAAVMIKPFSPLYLSQVVKDLTASFIETQEQYEN